MYASGAIDAVVVATPAGTHGQIVARRARRRHARLLREADRADRRRGLRARTPRARSATHVPSRLPVPVPQGLRRAARAAVDDLGQLDTRRTSRPRTGSAPRRTSSKSPWRATWAMAGGGVLMNQAIHQLDTMIAIAGMPSRVHGRVRAHAASRRRRRRRDRDARVGVGRDGRARRVALRIPAGYERLEFFGDRGALVLEDGYDLTVTEHDDAQGCRDECPDEYPELTHEWEPIEVARARSEWLDCLVDAHRDFAGAVLDGRDSAGRRRGGNAAVELANAIYCRRSRTQRRAAARTRCSTRPCSRSSWPAASRSDGADAPRARSPVRSADFGVR